MDETTDDEHAGCYEAYDRERRRRQFAEARMAALVVEFRKLAQKFDGISGHTTHDRLGGMTLGGAIRNITNGEKP